MAGFVEMTKVLLLVAGLLLPFLSSASEPTLQDTIIFEDRIDTLLDAAYLSPNNDLASLNSGFIKMHSFTNHLVRDLAEMLEEGKALTGYHMGLLKTSLAAYLTLAEKIDAKLLKQAPALSDSGESEEALRWLIASINFLQAFKNNNDLFYRSRGFRRLLRDLALDADSSIKGFKRLRKSVIDKNRVKALVGFTRRVIALAPQGGNAQLQSKLESTEFYKAVYAKQSIKSFYRYKSFLVSLGDGVVRVGRRFANGMSAGFGALAGPIEWRGGRLDQEISIQDALVSQLRPLDLLLEKKSFKLTDYTIPGYWGHIAVWLGTEAQLKRLGMWNHPVIVPFQEKIKQGYSIYEARREGVVWDRLDSWLDLDAVALLRHKPIEQYKTPEYAAVFQRLFSQIDKKFDYSFDLMTDSATTCTEIISSAYGPVNWPTSNVMGRYALQPDNIASLALYDNSPFELVLYVEGNKSGHKFEGLERFASLLGFRGVKGSAERFEQKFKKCARSKFRPKGPSSSCSVAYRIREYDYPQNYLAVEF